MSLFCKICFDAKNIGYDTHNLRNITTGKLTCKYLASLECNYCHEKGHTPSHCVQKNKYKDKFKVQVKVGGGWDSNSEFIGKEIGNIDTTNKSPKNKSTDGFMCLNVEEEELEVETEEEANNDYSDFDLPPVNQITWGSMPTLRWSA